MLEKGLTPILTDSLHHTGQLLKSRDGRRRFGSLEIWGNDQAGTEELKVVLCESVKWILCLDEENQSSHLKKDVPGV